jgi:transcription initiation factor TFIID TATA-box-binding protein
MTRPPRRLYITNITASATLDEKLDLHYLARKMLDVEYDKKKFSALIHRLRTPKATCMVSANGHIICVGTNTGRNALKALKKAKHHIARALGRDNETFKLLNFKIHNIASTYTYGTRLNLPALHQFYTGLCVYDPTIFSGLRFPGFGPCGRIKALLFPSGNIILIGANNTASLGVAFRELNLKIRTALADVRKKEIALECTPTLLI